MPRGLMLQSGAHPKERACVVPAPTRGRRQAVAESAPDAGSLSVAIELADQGLRGLSLPRSDYARLVADLYEGVRMRMPYRELMEFARATALCAARRRDGEPDGA